MVRILEPLEAAKEIDYAFDALGLPYGIRINRHLLEEIFENEMHLKDFAPIQARMHLAIKTLDSFDPMLSTMKSAITRRHPAIAELLSVAAKENLFVGIIKQPGLMKRMIHRIFLLEILIQEMTKSQDFMVKLLTHYGEKRRQLGIGSAFPFGFINLYQKFPNIFMVAKALTIDKCFIQNLDMSRKLALDEEDLKVKNKYLFLNIFEATAYDYVCGRKDNAFVGMALSMSLVKSFSVLGEEKILVQYFKDGWESLYETWNLAFVVGNFAYADYVLPKLLIPQVIDAKPGHYLFVRAITLWVIIQLYIFNLDGKGVVRPEMEVLSKRWGEINRGYAEEFLKSVKGEDAVNKAFSLYCKQMWSLFVKGKEA